ncbi:hypothetical protein TSUD_82250 [Trifolium subterraneum]|uniref:Uncharacterized protein n=1 Tax=Trifolium subterraneum TaxID=3900 RepID=A0A2Z6PGJ5_TRISU|nr:hypothetical protein TSUD_82250 [Trifolium subterraneum]
MVRGEWWWSLVEAFPVSEGVCDGNTTQERKNGVTQCLRRLIQTPAALLVMIRIPASFNSFPARF